MIMPFIRNHQYNLIRKQVNWLQSTIRTAVDQHIVESVRTDVYMKVMEAFEDANPEQRNILEPIAELQHAEQCQHYVQSLEPYREAFPSLARKQLQQLFPKVKKLQVPDLSKLDLRAVTYLGWDDTAANRLFLVYPLDGQLVGIAGRYTPSNKGTCFLCYRQEHVALFSAIQRRKPPKHASPDYYKAIGNYMCVDSMACNHNLTDTDKLEWFFREVAGTPRR